MGSSDGRAPVLEQVARGASRAGLLARLLDGAIDGFVLEGVLSIDVTEAVVRAATAIAPRRSPMYPGDTYGALLVLSAPDLADYFAGARALEHALLETRAVASMHRALAEASAPMPVEVPVHPSGSVYAELSVRSLAKGTSIAIHSERWEWESMSHLRTLLDPARHLSFYVPLTRVDAGGELVVYHRPTTPPPIEGLPDHEAHTRLAAFGASEWRPGRGDLLVFDGGRFNHRVTEVRSAEPRLTIGGFAAVARNRSLLYVWS